MHSSASRFPLSFLLRALAVYSILQIMFIGLAPIAGSTEAREAQVIDTILRDGNWVLPLRNGIIPSKPPLFHWIGAAISSGLGAVSEFTVRLPSHLAAVGVLFCVSLCAFRIAHYSQTVEGDLHQERVALLAPAILSLTYGFHQLGSQSMVDMVFTLCVWGALTSLVMSDPEEWRSRQRISSRHCALFWLFIATAIIARGPLGAALPLLLAGLSGWYLAGIRTTLREALRPSIGWFALLIPLAWYYAAYERGGDPFLERQLLFENVQRLVGGDKVNTEEWWFYGPSLLRTTAPWGAFMVFGVIRYYTKARGLSHLGGFKRWAIVPFIALVAGLAILSVASGKRHSYTLPLQPLIAIQAALLFSMSIERRGLRLRERLWRFMNRAEGILAVVIVLLLISIGIAHEVTRSGNPLEELLKFACAPLTVRCGTAVLFAFAVVGAVRRRGPGYPYARTWLLLVLLLTMCVSVGNVIKGALKGWPVVTEQLIALTRSGQRITVIKDPFDEYFDPIFYYAHQPISIVDASGGSKTCDPSTLYLARESWLERYELHFRGTIRRLASLREIKRVFLGGKGEDLTAFACSPARHNSEPEEFYSPLRDARNTNQGSQFG